MTEPWVQIAPVQLELTDLLKTQGALRGIDVVSGFVNTGMDIERLSDRQTLKPTAVLWFGAPAEDEAHGGIVSNRADSKTFTFSVLAMASSDYEVSQCLDVVNSIFSGYQPVNCSEISLVGGVSRSPVNSPVMPLRYYRTCGFYLTIDPSPVPSP